MIDLSALRAAVDLRGRVARVVVAEAKGSAPREAGAAMLVWDRGQSGTIGGGALEFAAVARAREALAGGAPVVEQVALGPDVRQCCGGAVVLLTEVWDAARLEALTVEAGLAVRAVTQREMPLAVARRIAAARGQGVTGGPVLVDGWAVEPVAVPARQLWVWGAGHVGRAVVAVMAPLPGLAVTWVDTGAARFPEVIPDGVTRLEAEAPALLVPYAPREAEHLILTYSHALDLELCHALLSHGFRGCGLIGSGTKWARFRRRLADLGHAPDAVGSIRCPIGDPAMGKHPQAIAVSVAGEFLRGAAVALRREGTG
jgi:xanthine dehydrogenase accessory factor